MKDRICWANEFQAFRVDLHYFAKGGQILFENANLFLSMICVGGHDCLFSSIILRKNSSSLSSLYSFVVCFVFDILAMIDFSFLLLLK